MKSADHVVIPVGLGDRSYDITIGKGIIGQADHILAPFITGRKVIILADTAIAMPWLNQLETVLAQIATCHSITTSGGEAANPSPVMLN